MKRRLSLITGLIIALSITIVPVAGAHDGNGFLKASSTLPTRIDLPDGFRPEGITSGLGRLFVGSVANGAIWRGSARTGEGRILVPGSTVARPPGSISTGAADCGWPEPTTTRSGSTTP